MLQYCVDNAGAPYSSLEILGIGWILLNSLFNRKVGNPFSDGKRSFICSEFVGEALKEIGYNISDPERLDPKEVYQFLSKMS